MFEESSMKPALRANYIYFVQQATHVLPHQVLACPVRPTSAFLCAIALCCHYAVFTPAWKCFMQLPAPNGLIPNPCQIVGALMAQGRLPSEKGPLAKQHPECHKHIGTQPVGGWYCKLPIHEEPWIKLKPWTPNCWTPN